MSIDQRLEIARALPEIEGGDLAELASIVRAKLCQARLRRLIASGVELPPGLLAVAVGAMPADVVDMTLDVGVELSCDYDLHTGGITVAPLADQPVIRDNVITHRAHRCSTCREVLFSGACACSEPVERARAAQDAELTADTLGELVGAGLAEEIGGGAMSVDVGGFGAAPPTQLERTLVIVDGLPDIGGPCAVVARGGYVRGVLRGWTTLGAALVDVDGVLGVYPEARRVG